MAEQREKGYWTLIVGIYVRNGKWKIYFHGIKVVQYTNLLAWKDLRASSTLLFGAII